MVKTDIRPEPIVNGSWNKTLTLSEIDTLLTEGELRTLVWYIHCDMDSSGAFRDTHPSVFYNDSSDWVYGDRDSMSHAQLKELAKQLIAAFKHKHDILLAKTIELEMRQGKEMCIKHREWGISYDSTLQLTLNQAIGYLKEKGSWNDFVVGRVARYMREMEKEFALHLPDFCDRNNPNYGMKRHKWYLTGDYIIAEVQTTMHSAATVEAIEKYIYPAWWAKGKEGKADSIRKEIEYMAEPLTDGVTVTLYWWWD